MSLFEAGQAGPGITLLDLLHIEDSRSLIEPHCPRTGVPAWSIIRIAFLRQLMADMLFGSGTMTPPAQPRTVRAATVLTRASAHNAMAVLRRGLRAEVLINTDTIGDTKRDGRWFNRYADWFGDLPSGQAVVLADLFDWQWHEPRHNERIVYHAPMQVAATLAARLNPDPAAIGLAETVVGLAYDRAQALLGWQPANGQRARFIAWAAQKIADLPFRYNAYRRLLARVRPRLLLGLAGCYGAHAPLIAAAKDAGVATAEFQHGAISAGHDAYNFAPAIFASDAYRRTLPDYLLTYGDWWNGQVHAPLECVTIGNPERAAKLAALGPHDADRTTVLILSDGIEFDLYLDFARQIAAAVATKGLRVVLRPHPLERDGVRRRFGSRNGDVWIDVATDIYANFASARIVVSEMSTGLFEAIGLVNGIVMLDTAKARFTYPEHPFAIARSVGDTIQLILDGEALPTVGADLWAEGWQENYAAFLANKAGIYV